MGGGRLAIVKVTWQDGTARDYFVDERLNELRGVEDMDDVLDPMMVYAARVIGAVRVELVSEYQPFASKDSSDWEGIT